MPTMTRSAPPAAAPRASDPPPMTIWTSPPSKAEVVVEPPAMTLKSTSRPFFSKMAASLPTQEGMLEALRLDRAALILMSAPLAAGLVLVAGLAAAVEAGADGTGAAVPPQPASVTIAASRMVRSFMAPIVPWARPACAPALAGGNGYDHSRMAALASAPTETAQALPAQELGRVRRRTTGLLFASQIFGSGGTTVALTVATILADQILGSSTWAGLPNSVRTLGAALFSLPLSAFMARFGRRNGLVLGYAIGVCGAAMSFVSAIALNYPLLLLGSAIFGGGYTANLLSRYAAADVSPATRRGKAISFVVWGATVGAVVGPVLIGPAGRWAENTGLPAIAGAFAVALLTFVVAGLMILAFLRPDPLYIARQLELHDPVRRATATARRLPELLRIPGVQVGLASLMCAHMVMIGIMSMTPVYMHEHGHSLQFVGLVISGHVTGMYVLSPFTGWLADRIGRASVVLLSAVTFMSAALLNALTPPDNQPLIALGMFLIGLGWNFGFVAGSALLTDSVEFVERPRIQGVADMSMGVSAALGSLASGPIMASHSYPTLNFTIVLLVVLPLTAVWTRQLRPQPLALRS